MESFKTPAGALAAVNTGALLGIYYILQRQLTEMSENQEKMDNKINRLYNIVLGPNGKQYEEIKEYVNIQKQHHPKNVKLVNKMKEESEKYKESMNELKDQLDKLVSELAKKNPEIKQIEKAKKEERIKVSTHPEKIVIAKKEDSEEEEDIMK